MHSNTQPAPEQRKNALNRENAENGKMRTSLARHQINTNNPKKMGKSILWKYIYDVS